MNRIIRTRDDLAALFRRIVSAGFPVTITVRDGEIRSDPQNRLQWDWAAIVGKETGETKDDVQRRWKLAHGVPILRAGDPVADAMFDRALMELDYQQRLAAMDYFQVSRVMTSAQFSEYLDAIEREATQAGIGLPRRDAA